MKTENPPLATPPISIPCKQRDLIKENIKRAIKRAINVPTISDIKLVDYEGDVSKKWYIEFYTTIEGIKERHRIKGGINRVKERKARTELAVAIVNELKTSIPKGVYELLRLSNTDETAEIVSESAEIAIGKALQRKINTVGARSQTAFKSAVNSFLRFYKGPVHEISWDVISDYVQSLYLKGLSHKTVHNNVSNLKNVMGYLKMDKSIFEGHGLKETSSGDTVIPWTDSELSALDKFTNTDDKLHIRAYWGLIYYCAIRPSEISSLQVSSFDMTNFLVTISSKYSKNKKTQTIIIPKPYRKTIVKYLATVPDKYFLFGNHLLPSAKKVNSNKYSAAFSKLIKIPLTISKNAYQLKHTAAIHLVKNNMNKTKIQHHFRHQSVEDTEIYLRKFEGHIFRDMEDAFPELD